MRTSKLLGFLLLATACATAPARGDSAAVAAVADAAAPEEPLPLDPDVRVGKLDNGLIYFIRKHGQPEKRVALWLAVDAGSVLEDDDQKGLAHFVEHMAFNGTERFEKNTLIDFIERAGMDFGGDLNAYTSFDETVYMLQVPTDDPKLIAMGMDILEDWAGALTFDPKEVDKERGVLIEEWRIGRGASQRVFDKQWPIFLEGSKYADRKPIGEKEILESAPVARVKDFYEDWYRPDLMAVVVVGDIDPDKMAAQIRTRFHDLEGPENPRERVNVPVPLLDRTRAAIITDPEANMTMVSFAIKGPYAPLISESDYRDELVDRLFHSMLGARFQEISREPDAPFVFSFGYTSDMGRAVDVFRLFAMAKPGQVEKTLEVQTTEVERVRRHGFLAAELERAKKESMRRYERAALEKDKAESRAYVREIVRHFLGDEAMPGRKAELDLATKYLPGITLDEINALAGEWTARKDRVVMASGPAREKMPGEKRLLAIVDEVSKRDIEPHTEEAVATTLMAKAPTPGTVKKEETLDAIDVTVWTLSNGARVVVKPTDFKNDEVQLRAISPGGHSLAKTKDYRSAASAARITSQAGLGQFDATAIRKMMAGKVARVSPFIGEVEEGLRGSASPKDLETLMQMIHLTFTAPRRDEKAFAAWKSSTATFVKNRDLSPQRVFSDKMAAFGSNNHPRRMPMTMNLLETVDLNTAHDFFRDRFADAGDFTFVFVGNLDLARLKKLSETYLASLPTTGRDETWRDVGVKKPRGIKKLTVEKGQDPKSFVTINYHGRAKWSRKAAIDIDNLAEVLNIRLREVLREELSGVYGAYSRGNIERRPKQRYTYSIGFPCGPKKADELKKAVFDIIASIKKDGVEADYLDKVREQRRRKLETSLEKNRFWMRKIVDHRRYGTDPTKIVEIEKEAIERVTSDNIKRAAKRYLGRQRIEGTLMPEPGASEAGADKNKPAAKSGG